MIFSKLILLIFTSGIFHLEASLQAIFENEGKVKTQHNLMTEFMTDLGLLISQNFAHHRVTVIGKREDFLTASTALLDVIETPYSIGTRAAEILISRETGADCILLFSIDAFNDTEIKTALAKLSENNKCKTLIMTTDENKISTAINSAIENRMRNVLSAHFHPRIIRIYGKVMNENCEEKVTLLNTWSLKNGFEKSENVIGRSLKLNEHGCPIFVSTFRIYPTMMLREGENGSFQITGGVEGHLITIIARYLNAVPVIVTPTAHEQLVNLPDGTTLGIVGDVARGLADFGIGQIRPTLRRSKLVDLLAPHSHECMVWTVPVIIKKDNHKIIISEFTRETWIVLILVVLLSYGVARAIRKGSKSSVDMCDMVMMTLGHAVPRLPRGLAFRLFILSYVYYSRVIYTAYSASLNSILTANNPQQLIVDHDGIINAGLRTAGSRSVRAMFATLISTDEGLDVELLNRFEIITSTKKALKRISEEQDLAYLRHLSSINYAAKEITKKGESVKFRTLPECVVSYNSVMVATKGSHLNHLVSILILRIRAAGIDVHWTNLEGRSEVKMQQLEFHNFGLTQLSSVFYLYLGCLVPALFTLFAELIAERLKEALESRLKI